jgi:hypothetical protein
LTPCRPGPLEPDEQRHEEEAQQERHPPVDPPHLEVDHRRAEQEAAGWAAVSPQKFGSWFLLMIISYTLVAVVSRPTSPCRYSRQTR